MNTIVLQFLILAVLFAPLRSAASPQCELTVSNFFGIKKPFWSRNQCRSNSCWLHASIAGIESITGKRINIEHLRFLHLRNSAMALLTRQSVESDPFNSGGFWESRLYFQFYGVLAHSQWKPKRSLIEGHREIQERLRQIISEYREANNPIEGFRAIDAALKEFAGEPPSATHREIPELGKNIERFFNDPQPDLFGPTRTTLTLPVWKGFEKSEVKIETTDHKLSVEAFTEKLIQVFAKRSSQQRIYISFFLPKELKQMIDYSSGTYTFKTGQSIKTRGAHAVALDKILFINGEFAGIRVLESKGDNQQSGFYTMDAAFFRQFIRSFEIVVD